MFFFFFLYMCHHPTNEVIFAANRDVLVFVLCNKFTVWRDTRCHVCVCVTCRDSGIQTSHFPFSLPFSFSSSSCLALLSPSLPPYARSFSLPDCLPACQAADKHFPWICHSHLASIWFFSSEVIGSGGKH